MEEWKLEEIRAPFFLEGLESHRFPENPSPTFGYIFRKCQVGNSN